MRRTVDRDTDDVNRNYIVSYRTTGGRYDDGRVDYCSEVRRCEYVYKADVQRSGVFESPNYPESYPPGVTCRYRFIGGEVDRVQLRFTQFRLRYHDDDAADPYE